MSREELLKLVEAWVGRAWLRPLDRAFLRFLDGLAPDAGPMFLLAATLASHQLGRGHVCLDLAATLDDPDATLSLPPESERGELPHLLPSRLLKHQALDDWRRQVAASPLVAEGAGNSPLVLAGHRLYLRRYWQYEQQVAQAVTARLNRPAAPPADLAERLAALFRPQANRPDWQKIACALAIRGALTVITGGPGTGKTTTVVRLLALLQSAARQAGGKLRIRLAAPTGKAAARLTESIAKAVQSLPEDMREAIPGEATTLHRLLGARPNTRRLRHHAGNPVHADWVVVDEASMIDLEMMAALLDALAPETRLVLLGDKDQLASVEAGAVLGDLCQDAGRGYGPTTLAWLAEMTGEDASACQGDGGALAQQIALLQTSHRFRADSGIGRLALAVNAGDVAEVGRIWQHRYADIAQIPLRGQDDGRLRAFALDGGAALFPPGADTAQGYRHYLELLRDTRPAPDAPAAEQDAWAGRVLDAFDRFQLLCALRRGPWGVEGLNRLIAETLAGAGLIEQPWGWYEGRPVIVTRNDYSLGLMNGDIGVALKFPGADGGSQLRIVFRQSDHRLKRVLPSRLTDIETVYAMTVHKSQGSEFAHVGLVLPDKPNPVLTRELVYTGITRARQWFTLLTPNPAMLAQAVARQVRRTGGLADLLAGNACGGPP
jgi:exodeoxyribonuclease V alpha subunit